MQRDKWAGGERPKLRPFADTPGTKALRPLIVSTDSHCKCTHFTSVCPLTFAVDYKSAMDVRVWLSVSKACEYTTRIEHRDSQIESFKYETFRYQDSGLINTFIAHSHNKHGRFRNPVEEEVQEFSKARVSYKENAFSTLWWTLCSP